jgi:hypothetical protein
MLHYYAVKNLMDWMRSSGGSFSDMQNALKDPCRREWVNFGGQLIPADDVTQLRADIGEGKLASWQAIHGRYGQLWQVYPLEKQRHAYHTLCELLETESLTAAQWQAALERAVRIQDYICEQVYQSRKKDFDNPFKQVTYRTPDEMAATVGTVEEDAFIAMVRSETQEFKETAEAIKKRG